MKIAIGADHAGYALKCEIAELIGSLGHELTDVGTHSSAPVDYPDIAAAACALLVSGAAERGVLICGSGVGVSVVANKFRGVRAGLCHDTYSAHQGVEHDDMNVLVLGARVIGVALAREIVPVFLAARYTNEERHARRLGKLLDIERRECGR
jgi:RpiB/LacA/LacB family sugar-phosphate isomerase